MSPAVLLLGRGLRSYWGGNLVGLVSIMESVRGPQARLWVGETDLLVALALLVITWLVRRVLQPYVQAAA